MGVIKKQKIVSVDEDVETLKLSHIADGNSKGYHTMGNNLAISQEVKHRVTM